MPSYMLIGLWDGIASRKMREINHLNHASAMLHEREIAIAQKAKNYSAKGSYPFRLDGGDKAEVSTEVKAIAQEMAEAGELPPQCVTDLIKWKIVTPFLVPEYMIPNSAGTVVPGSP
jgi:hypothetical protein